MSSNPENPRGPEYFSLIFVGGLIVTGLIASIRGCGTEGAVDPRTELPLDQATPIRSFEPHAALPEFSLPDAQPIWVR